MQIQTIIKETEPIHTPSFSIGDSLGDIKVALMDLKTRSERIEGSMLSREYFDESLVRNDKSDLIVSKLDETLRVLAESQPRKPSIEPSNPSIEPRIPSLTEEAADRPEKREVSLKLQQVLEVFVTRRRTTPKQLSQTPGNRDKHSLRTPQETRTAGPCSKSEPRVVRGTTRGSLYKGSSLVARTKGPDDDENTPLL